MLRKIFSTGEYTFWIIAAFCGFFFFYRTSNADLVHIPKLIVEALFLVYAFIVLFLSHNFDLKTIRNDRSFQFIVFITSIYLIWITLTNTIFSSVPAYTLLGWPDWFSGYSLYLMCLLYFFLPAFTYRLARFDTAVQMMFWLSSFVAVLCLLEYVGFNIFLTSNFLQNLLHYKFNTSTASFPVLSVGNSGYIGSLWLLFLPLPLLLLHQGRRGQAYVWWLILACGLASTHSKIAIIIAIFFFIILLFRSLKVKNFSLIFTLLASMAIAALGANFFEFANTFLYNHHIVDRSLKQNFDVSRSLKDRIYIWEGSLNAWKTRPLTGWGLETLQNNFFDYVPQGTLDYYAKIFAQKTDNESVRHFGNLLVIVPKYGKPKILRQVFTFNVKPHNYFVEEIYSNGIIGLILLMMLLIAVARYCIMSGSRESRLLLLGFGMYLIYLCGWFITIAVSPLAFVLLGFAVHLAAQKRAEDRQALLTVDQPTLPDTV